MELITEVKKIICKHAVLDIDESELNINTDLVGDLGINSISLILIIIDLEEKFEISIDEDEVDFNLLTEFKYLNDTVERLVKMKEN